MKIIPLIDRLNYESLEVRRATMSSSHSIRHLLYLNKSMRVYAEDGERVKEMLEGTGELINEKGGGLYLIKFIIKYIENFEVTHKQNNRVNSIKIIIILICLFSPSWID